MEPLAQNRAPAIKTSSVEISSGEFYPGDEQNSAYLLTSSGKKLFRVSFFATILQKETIGSVTTFYVDDGLGQLPLRCFEENKNQSLLTIGDVILIIGKIRKYNQEVYISPEIMKKISPLWLKVHSLEISRNTLLNLDLEKEKNGKKELETREVEKEKVEIEIVETEIVEEEIKGGDIKEVELPINKLLKLIKELDLGEGVNIEELVQKSFLKDAEHWIEKMLETGDIFQCLPGKVKVL